MPAYTHDSNSSFASKSLPPALCKLRTGRRPVMKRVSAFQGLSISAYLISRLADYSIKHGFAVPAAAGAKMARPDPKTIVLVGDGAFQTTGMELSIIIKHQLVASIIVLDNRGYETERLIYEGMFNDINSWQYQMLPQVLGGGKGHEVCNEREFDKALSESLINDTVASLIRVHTTVKITGPPLIASVQV